MLPIQQKTLTGRILALDSLLDVESRHGPAAVRRRPALITEFELVLNLHAAPEHWPQRSPDSQSLPDFIRALHHDLIPRWTSQLQAHAPHLSDLTQTLFLRITRFETDYAQDGGGHGPDLLKRLFDYAAHSTREFYGFTVRTTLELEVPWHTPVSFGRYHLNASAHRRGRQAIVTLVLSGLRFDLKSYHAVLYVLLHELIAHVYARAHGSASPAAVPPESEFEEGYMDAVVRILLESLEAQPPPPNLAPLAPFFREGADYHCARHQDDGTVAALTRAYGRNIAQNFRALFTRVLGDSGDAHFLRLSLDWNALDIPPEEKDTLVRCLGAHLAYLNNPQNLEHQRAFARLLKTYASTHDLLTFLHTFPKLAFVG